MSREADIEQRKAEQREYDARIVAERDARRAKQRRVSLGINIVSAVVIAAVGLWAANHGHPGVAWVEGLCLGLYIGITITHDVLR